ncbi:unnamed protein product [Rotaria sp. Silwood1]|nr:unnamed protein product [Rotaria sp. Silwood1]CAF4779432.1 unnamed protein product [Rotaria sp. Silwood1]
MPRDTTFNPCWLNRTDDDSIELSKWLTNGKTTKTFKCLLCKTNDLDCSNRGWSAIEQHMKTKNHVENIKSLKNNSTFVIGPASTSTEGVIPTAHLRLGALKQPLILDFQEQVTKAEAVWALTVAQRAISFNSCNEIGDVFRIMFPDSKIAKEFSMQAKKISYVLSYGLGPHFHQELVKSLKRNDKFVLCFDEQTNNQNRKQLDLLVRYWCFDQGRVVTRYYKTILLGHATAIVLKNAILDALKTDGLDLKKLLMLGRDSPYVNLSLEKMIEAEMEKIGGGLLKIGGCHLHVVHNGFKAGLLSTDWHAQNKCIDLYAWFKRSPARQEDLVDIIEDFNILMEKTLLYFTSTRWVLLGKVITRVLTLWEPLKEYFLVLLPTKEKKQIQKNDRYDRIKLSLTSYTIKIQLQFVLFLCETIFDRFLTFFQQEAPLIHLLYVELSALYRDVLVQFLVPDYVGNKTGNELLNLDFKLKEKQLNNKQIRIGESTRKLLMNITQKEREDFFEDVRTIYHAIAQYFKNNLPLNCSFVRDMQIFNPSFKSAEYTHELSRIAKAIPGLLTDTEIDHIRDEWINYSLENFDQKWIVEGRQDDGYGNEKVIFHRIDYFWNHVLSMKMVDGRPKFPILGKLIKNILIIPHGNADIERGFSINENIVTSNRSNLSNTSINALRSTYDGVKFLGDGSSHKVYVNKDMIKMVQSSHLLYKQDLNSRKAAVEQLEKENEEMLQVDEACKEILKEEGELLSNQKDLQQQLLQASQIITEATARLQIAIKNKDNLDMDRASILIDGGNMRNKSINEQLVKVTEDLIKIQKKRKDAFDQLHRLKRQKCSTN